MNGKAQSGAEGSPDEEPTEADLAACALTVELIRSGRIITYIGDILVERVDETDHPGEPPEALVIRRFIDQALPHLVEQGPETCWKTAGLIESIRETLVTDFQLELEGEERRN
jgi:hypothetical protein